MENKHHTGDWMKSSQMDAQRSTPESRLHSTLAEVRCSLGDQPNYDSVSSSEETPLFRSQPIDSQSSYRAVRGSSFREKLLLAILVACIVTIITLLHDIRADHDGDLAELLLDIPMLGRSRHRAQRYAEMAETYLSEIEFDYKEEKSRKGLHVLHAPEGCEATVLLLRHCEKARIREHCDYVGYERSVYLSTIFGDGDERWPAPSYIFALAPGGRHNPKKHNFREVETVKPLADKVNVTINDSFDTKHTTRMAKHLLALLRSGEMCGKLAVVNWKHSDIPHLAHKLGCGPKKGCPMDYPAASFDEAWQIRFVYKKPWHSSRRSGKIADREKWEIYGSVQNEGFDPLSFSKKYNDYKPGGTNHGARWSDEAMEVTDGYARSIDENF